MKTKNAIILREFFVTVPGIATTSPYPAFTSQSTVSNKESNSVRGIFACFAITNLRLVL